MFWCEKDHIPCSPRRPYSKRRAGHGPRNGKAADWKNPPPPYVPRLWRAAEYGFPEGTHTHRQEASPHRRALSDIPPPPIPVRRETAAASWVPADTRFCPPHSAHGRARSLCCPREEADLPRALQRRHPRRQSQGAGTSSHRPAPLS